uniref:Uncharacterized protein n=1 Tax=Anguilla anguilla TaxID=7936 RepID=A0A0E9RMU7_ANGAN
MFLKMSQLTICVLTLEGIRSQSM